MIEGLPGGFPVQRREHGDVVDGPGGQLGQHVIEIIAQIDRQALAGLHNRKDRSDFGTGFLAPDMQPILATDCEPTHRHSLCGDGDYAEIGASELNFQEGNGLKISA